MCFWGHDAEGGGWQQSDKSCLSEEIPSGEDIVSPGSNKAAGAPSHSAVQVGRLWWDGCGLVGNQRDKALVGCWSSEVVFSGVCSTWRQRQVKDCRGLSW